jgi:hypothetical protein
LQAVAAAVTAQAEVAVLAVIALLFQVLHQVVVVLQNPYWMLFGVHLLLLPLVQVEQHK